MTIALQSTLESRLSREWRVIGLALSVLTIVLCVSGVTQRVDNVIYDWSLRVFPSSASKAVTVVAIDQKSIDALGAWPWPRSIHAKLLQKLAEYQPRAVDYDVLFLNPGADPAQDQELASAVSATPRTYLPAASEAEGTNGRGLRFVPPITLLSDAAKGVGEAEVRPDADGVVRRVTLAIDDEKRWTHVAALMTQGVPAADHRLDLLPPFAKPAPGAGVNRFGSVLIPFRGARGSVQTVSFLSVLRGEAPAGLLRGKYVVVGATSRGLGDQFFTAGSLNDDPTPDAVLHATVIDSLISNRIIGEAPTWARMAAALTVMWVTLLGLVRLQSRSSAILGVAVLFEIFAVSGVLLWTFHLWLPPTVSVLMLLISERVWGVVRLNAVSDFMVETMSAYDRDPDEMIPGLGATSLAADRLALQVDMLRGTLDRSRALRKLVSTVIQGLPDATLVVNLDGVVVLENQAARQMFNPTGPAHLDDVDQYFENADPPLPPFGPATLADPALPWWSEQTGRDGSIREIRHVDWRDYDGETIGWIVRFADITAARTIERRREESLQLLTHDMRAPQAAILALLAENRAKISEHLRERVRHYAQRTIELADGFLHLARAEAGGYPMRPVDMADILVEAVDDLWPQSSAREVKIKTVGVNREYLVAGNRSLLTRALVNLVGNAIKFSHRGDQIICEVSLQADASGASRVVCTVADKGIGISPEAVGDLFKRFRSIRGGDEGGVEGVGLGLAFVQSVAIGHRGSIVCHSEVDRGSTFILTLPAFGSEVWDAEAA